MLTPPPGFSNGPLSGPTTPCTKAQTLFSEAANPAVSFVRLTQIRNEFVAMDCASCAGAFETEIKFRTLLSASLATDQPSPDLAGRISASLASIDLSQLDASDIEF